MRPALTETFRKHPSERKGRPQRGPTALLVRHRWLWAGLALAALTGVGVSRVWMHWSLLRGPFPLIVEGLGTVMFLATLARRAPHWWTRVLPVLAVITGTAVIAASRLLRAQQIVTESYPKSFLVWLAAAIFTVVALPVGFRKAPRSIKIVHLLAIPLSMSSAFLLINSHYGYWPTFGDLVGGHVPGQVSASALARELAEGKVPSAGRIATFDAPAVLSRFSHRTGYIYLPPAFFTQPHDSFPVFVMVGGEPGAPSDWLRAGLAADTANAFAATHHGMGPVMIFVDHNGGPTRDSECVDGPRGFAETYVADDVPRAAIEKFGLSRNPGRWGIAGFSEGGTCALLLSLRHPTTFGHYVNLAGDDAPRLWNFPATLRYLFGGDRAKLQSYDSRKILREHRFFNMTAWYGAGLEDDFDVQHMKWERNDAQKAGIVGHVVLVPGQAHSWAFGAAAFKKALPGLMQKMGIDLATGASKEPPVPSVVPVSSGGSPSASPSPRPRTTHTHHPSPRPSASPSPTPSASPSPSPSPLL